jgi:hypothetical protein
MPERRALRYRPGLERLEVLRPLSAAASTAAIAGPRAGAGAGDGALLIPTPGLVTAATAAPITASPLVQQKPTTGFLLYRITNPNRFNNRLIPPFRHVLVQSAQPVPGDVYNILFVVVRNGTAQTFDASSGFRVRFPGQPGSFPILTGDQQWKPGEQFVFYVLTKKYYPMPSQVHSGFEFDLGGARSIAIPGPSGIFLRITYNPATFDRTLDWIVAFGPGAQGGKGPKFGLPDTAINEFVSAATNRSDFGGYF